MTETKVILAIDGNKSDLWLSSNLIDYIYQYVVTINILFTLYDEKVEYLEMLPIFILFVTSSMHLFGY